MLKAQLRSKIGALDPKWRKIEDILTGDFFGALDYLPRQPFLREFVEQMAALNPGVPQPPCEGVVWEDVESQFWPMIEVENKWVEPDVVLVSNRWVLVIEVKLYSGLGLHQPWREYLAGKEIAEERGLPEDSVFYLLVTRHRLDVVKTFVESDENNRRELVAKTSHFLWHEAASLVHRWLPIKPTPRFIRPEQDRLLSDLRDALKRRGFIAFCKFKFAGLSAVSANGERLFCPDRFTGFLRGSESRPIPNAKETRFLSRFAGFLESSPRTAGAGNRIFLCDRFTGFSSADRAVAGPSEPFLPVTTFAGFLDRCPACNATSTMTISAE